MRSECNEQSNARERQQSKINGGSTKRNFIELILLKLMKWNKRQCRCRPLLRMRLLSSFIFKFKNEMKQAALLPAAITSLRLPQIISFYSFHSLHSIICFQLRKVNNLMSEWVSECFTQRLVYHVMNSIVFNFNLWNDKRNFISEWMLMKWRNGISGKWNKLNNSAPPAHI